MNDLLHPTAKAESLLEALTTEQLNVIEQTLNKIREKKHLSEGNALDGRVIVYMFEIKRD